MLNRNAAAITIIAFGLIILIGLVWFMFLAPVPAPAPTVPPATGTPQTGTQTALPEPAAVSPPTVRRTVASPTESTEDEVRRLATAAVERYGTYSNQAGYENIKDLELFMSSAFLTRSRQTIERTQAAGSDTSIYYGITTKAAAAETVQFDRATGTATFRVQAQRREFVGSADNVRSFRQAATVAMVKEGGVWKVDGITWED